MSALVLVCTVLAETSPQALPLGAACIVSAINAAFGTHNSANQGGTVRAELACSSLEDAFSAETLAARLLEKHPAAVCFSVFVWNRQLLTRTAAIIRSRTPHVFLIAGGPEITARPESFSHAEASADTGKTTRQLFDFLVQGEGESTVPALLEELFSSVHEGRKIRTPHVLYGARPEVHSLPSPYLDGTLDPQTYGNGALWELARGCPFKCSYCYESKGEKTVAYFPMERIRAELDFFVRKKVRQIFVLDPTYNADKKRALDMLAYIKRSAPDIFFHFECRAEFLDAALAQAFASVSCSLQIGLQSAHEQVLALVHRGFNKKDFVKKIGLLNKNGAVFGFDLIYGLPGDSLSGFRDSIDFAVALYPNSLEIFRLSVLPGTDLYDRREELGLSAQGEAPYHITALPTFPEDAIEQAEVLGKAASLFYSAGRAVSWFNAVIAPLHSKPSAFFTRFARWLETEAHKDDEAQPHQERIELLQTEFVTAEYTAKKLGFMLCAALDIIRLNGALSRAYAEGSVSETALSYHPEDLLSPYSQDISFFCKNAKKHACRVRVSPDKTGPQWKIINR